MLNIVYILEFKDTEKVYIGLSNDLNWDISIKSTLFNSEYNLEIEEIRILEFNMDERLAKIDYKMWVEKTDSKNINCDLSDKIPDKFISQTLKEKKHLRRELHRLENKYTSLFNEFKIMEESYLRLDEIIDTAIHESISAWKELDLKDSE